MGIRPFRTRIVIKVVRQGAHVESNVEGLFASEVQLRLLVFSVQQTLQPIPDHETHPHAE